MGGTPPDDDEPGDELDEALAQVEQTLLEQGVADPELRKVLIEQVRSALESAGDWGELSFSVKVQGPEDEEGAAPSGTEASLRPTVSIVDGGRRGDQPRIPRGRPDLRVADEAEPDDGAAEAPAAGAGASRTIVRTIRRSAPPAARSVSQGWIELGSHGQQAVYLGHHARCYRVLCTQGSLTVRVDGEHRQVLLVGQSVDVEGASIVVLAEDGGVAQGAYTAV
jgi:hypothetical protein